MTKFQMHTIETAPEASRPDLEATRKSAGFIPNLYGYLAEAPAALKAYIQVTALLDKHTSLSGAERHLVAVAISRDNKCGYCVAAHSTGAKMMRASDEDIQAARDGKQPGDAKLAALLRFATALFDSRGHVSDDILADFYNAGYTQRHALEVVTVAALKTLSNFSNHLADTPIDEAFSAYAWAADGND